MSRDALPGRADLPGRIVETLNSGGRGNADVLLVQTDQGVAVLKDFGPRALWMRPIARWLVRRELRAHRQLQGHAFVPSILGSLDALGFYLEYRPGEMLSRSLRAKLPATFLTELRAAIEQMHARGVAHLDLRHRSNILAGSDGHPVLLDFASAICFHPGSLAARWILPQLARVDLRALEKWEHKLGPPEGA